MRRREGVIQSNLSTILTSEDEPINLWFVVAGVSVVSLDKNLEINHIPARVGDNVEIKCDVTGTPPPPLVWRRYNSDLEALAEPEVTNSLWLARNFLNNLFVDSEKKFR